MVTPSALPVRVTQRRRRSLAIGFVVIAMALGTGMPAERSGAADTAHIGAPVRQSGWWEFIATSDRGEAMGVQYLCVGARSEAAFSAFDQLAEGTCTRRIFRPAGGGWTFDYACDDGAGTSRAKGKITGDISTAYQVTQSVDMAGLATKGTVAATWIGACPAGRREGDFVVSPHIVINVLE